MPRHRCVVAACLAFFAASTLTACTNGARQALLPANAGAYVQPQPSKAAHRKPGHLLIAIRVPRRHRHARGARFISPATLGMTVAISGPTNVDETVSLQPTATGCSSSLTGTFCTLSASLTPCPTHATCYTASVATYDAVQCNSGTCTIPGNAKELSANQNVAFTVASGQNNTIAMTLYGIPHALAIAGTSAMTAGAPGGLQLFGNAAQSIVVTATDADGNLIVGAGSPTYSASITSGTSWSVSATPAPSAPNTLQLTPPGVNGSRANLHVVASASESLCSQTGAVCTADFSLADIVQNLIVSCTSCAGYNGAFVEYSLPYTGAYLGFYNNGGNVGAFAVDAAGYLLTYSNPTVEFLNPLTVGGGEGLDPNVLMNAPTIMMASKSTFAYVRPDDNDVCKFASFQTEACTYPGFNATSGAMNAAGDIALASASNLAFIPAGGSAVSVPSSGSAGPVLIDAAQDIFTTAPTLIAEYVSFNGGGAATVNPGLSAVTAATLDSSGDVFAGGNGKIVEVAPPYNKVTATITAGLGTTIGAMAVDAFGNLYVTNPSAGNVAIYAPPYDETSPSATIPVATGYLAIPPQ